MRSLERRRRLKKRTMGTCSFAVFLLALLLVFMNSGSSCGAAETKELTLLYTGNFMGQLTPQKG